MATDVLRLIEACKALGLTGSDATDFIRQAQAEERDERAKEREREREREEREREHEEREREERERQRVHEIELRRLEIEHPVRVQQSDNTSRLPKLPQFVDGKDDLGSYFERFERFATLNNWEQERWGIALSALLTGKALDVYSRLSVEAAADYALLKEALLSRYDLTEEGFRQRFRDCTAEEGETPEQFVERLKGYFNNWVKLSGI